MELNPLMCLCSSDVNNICGSFFLNSLLLILFVDLSKAVKTALGLKFYNSWCVFRSTAICLEN